MNIEKFRNKAKELCAQLTLDEKLSLICTHQRPIEKIGLGEFYVGTEVARGFVGRSEERFSTVFPQPIGLAGTFDTELMSKLGEIAGNEARAFYNGDPLSSPCMWGPTVDMERDPRWGRTEEAYGEDVCLAGEMTRAYTETMAADNGEFVKTIPTLKHFCANNNERHRGSCNAYLPLRLKYEYYYAAFMNAVKYGGAKSVMTAYNEINGIPALCNPELETILKNDWGLWFAVTDGGDFSQNVTSHRYGENHAETLAEALKAGCNVMTDTESIVRDAAKKALRDGLLTESDIDRSAENVLYARLRLGQLSDDCPYGNISKDIRNSPESARINLRAAKEQVVLLKNDGILPLKKAPQKIAVLGPLADENLRDWYTGQFINAVSPAEGIRREFPESEVICDNLWNIYAVKAPNGKYLSVHEDGSVKADADEVTDSELFEVQNWGENWNNLFSVKYKKYLVFGNDTLQLHNRHIYDWFTRETFNLHSVSPTSFIFEEYLTHSRMFCSEDGTLEFRQNQPVCGENTFELVPESFGDERGIEIARNCDIVIYCTGNHPVQVAKECHDRKTLGLNIQFGRASVLKSFNPNTIMALISSYPYAVCHENEVLPAILYSTHCGATLGTALAETISGKNNPAGRLALTWYRSELDLPDIMDYDIEKCGTTYMYFKGTPLYPFGYGLSYSAFEYKSLEVRENPDGSLSADVTVKNVSDTGGDEVIQLYFAVPDSQVSRPAKKLCAFARVHFEAHEEKTVTLAVKEHILQIYDVRRRCMMTENGLYRFFAGGSSAELPLSAEIRVNGKELGKRSETFEAQSFDIGNTVEIAWSRRLKRQYIRANGWVGTVVYGGTELSGKTALKLTISSVMGNNQINVDIGGKVYTVDVEATSAYDDFREYILPIENTDSDRMTITLKEQMGILDIGCINTQR